MKLCGALKHSTLSRARTRIHGTRAENNPRPAANNSCQSSAQCLSEYSGPVLISCKQECMPVTERPRAMHTSDFLRVTRTQQWRCCAASRLSFQEAPRACHLCGCLCHFWSRATPLPWKLLRPRFARTDGYCSMICLPGSRSWAQGWRLSLRRARTRRRVWATAKPGTLASTGAGVAVCRWERFLGTRLSAG